MKIPKPDLTSPTLHRLDRTKSATRRYLRAGLVASVAAALLIAGWAESGGDSALARSAHASRPDGDSSPITIGIIADTSGATKTIGEQFINGSEAAAKLFGPINGRSVKFVIGNGDDFSASAASAKVIQLKSEDNAVAILGMASSECDGAISVAARVQIPMIGNSCSIQNVVGSDCNYWFINGGPAPSVSAKAMAIAAKKEFPDLIGSKWVVIGDDPGWSESVAQYWDAIPGAKHANVQVAPFGTTDWAPYIAKLKATGAKAALLAISWGSQYAAFVQQAKAAGLYKTMKIVAPVGFPENSMIPGYGTSASTSTVAALEDTEILSQYGGSWTYIDQTALGRRYTNLFYSMFHYPSTTQANVAMADTWMVLEAIKETGSTNATTLMQKLTTGSFLTPYWNEPLSVQADGRQLNLPTFGAKIESLAKKTYGVTYAVKVLFAMPPSETVGTASSYGCTVKQS